MGPLEVAEVFGNDTALKLSADVRSLPVCPFRDGPCTKDGKTAPLGICSYTDGLQATVVCPVRFLEKDRVFVDVGRLAFGNDKRLLVVPEVRLLEVPATGHKIGKVDFLIALLDEDQNPIDFAAVEIQAVYMSGKTSRPAFDFFLEKGIFTRESRRRADFRSSAQKRLMPQLSLKVPVFRRWGKRVYIVVDQTFFEQMPKLRPVSEHAAEITWVVYPILRNDFGFSMREPVIVHSNWDDVLTALREGEPPPYEEILRELAEARNRKRGKRLRVIST